jgi:alanyl-tRNA synthetase
LHAALRKVLGEHVQQQGSRVAPEGLRFDFTHHQGVSPEELSQIEGLVNRSILADMPIRQEVHSLDEAKQLGAMALFGEKYGDRVRVIRMGEFSMELCGGTHAQATGQIGFIKVLSESSVAAGVRRIEAVTGEGALNWSHQQAKTLDAVAHALKAKPGQETQRALEAMERLKVLEKEVAALRAEQARTQARVWLQEKSQTRGNTQVLLLSLSQLGWTRDQMPVAMDALADLLSEGLVVLTHADSDTLSIGALSGPEARKKLKAGDLVKKLAEVAGGKGGGRPDRAQAGSKEPGKESEVLREAERLTREVFGD